MNEDRARRILAEAIEINRVFDVARKQRHALGITGTKIGILKLLKTGDARLTVLADQLSVSLPVASRAVSALEGDGYVERRTDPHDARASLLSLSPAGLAYVRARQSQFIAHFARGLADWSDEDAAQAEAILSRLREPLRATFEHRPEEHRPGPEAQPTASSS